MATGILNKLPVELLHQIISYLCYGGDLITFQRLDHRCRNAYASFFASHLSDGTDNLPCPRNSFMDFLSTLPCTDAAMQKALEHAESNSACQNDTVAMLRDYLGPERMTRELTEQLHYADRWYKIFDAAHDLDTWMAETMLDHYLDQQAIRACDQWAILLSKHYDREDYAEKALAAVNKVRFLKGGAWTQSAQRYLDLVGMQTTNLHSWDILRPLVEEASLARQNKAWFANAVEDMFRARRKFLLSAASAAEKEV